MISHSANVLLLRWSAFASVAFVTASVACSSRDDGFAGPPSELISIDSGPPESAPPSGCEGKKCSRDLHKVVDGCTEAVIEECGEGRGCSNGSCVTACTSAANAQGSIGCSFWTVPPDAHVPTDSSCFAAFVANTWDQPATVTAELGSETIDISQSLFRVVPTSDGKVGYEPISGGIPPGEVGILFLSQGDARPDTAGQMIACPPGVKPAFHGILPRAHTTSLYEAFHLSTNVPVSAYAIFPYGGADSHTPSATLLTPSTSWDTSYLIVDPWPYETSIDRKPFVQIVAREDTEVRLRPKVDVTDGVDVTGGPRGSVVKWNLARGQVLELAQFERLIGSALETSHPVGVFGGHQCAYLPHSEAACDGLYQQIPPVRQWSSAYSAVPYRSRRVSLGSTPPRPEEVTWQVLAANEGTVLTYDPAPPFGAPQKLGAGEHVLFSTDQLFGVRSQDAEHPIYLAVYMSGLSKYSTLGDPDFVNVVPNDQFLDHYVFFVDYTYRDSTLTLVRRKDANGFHDVNLDCTGTITGWQPLGNDGMIEFAWVDITRDGQEAGACSYGRHEASSDGPFGLYVWGMDDAASYGFPAGAGSRPTSPYLVIVK